MLFLKKYNIRQLLFNFKRVAVGLSFYLLDSIYLLFLPAQSQNSKIVLVVRLDNIGDFILWIPAAKELRALYPATEWQLILLANKTWADMAKELDIFDEVLPIDRQRLFMNLAYRFRALCQSRRASAHIAIQPTYSRDMLRDDALIRASGAEQRIGSQGDCSNTKPWLKLLADRTYTRLVPATAKPIHELERNAEFVAGLGGVNRLDLPSLSILSTQLPSVLDGITYFVLFPGASWAGKQWPAARFAELAVRIRRQTGWVCVICGGEADVITAQKIQTLAGPPVINLAGKTDVRELLATLAGSRLVITNDTSAAHMSPAVGTPTVCILGGGHYGRFLPYSLSDDLPNMVVVNKPMECYGCNWRCIYPVTAGDAMPCIAQISVEAVWQAVCRVLPADCCN
jgi:ADP-heptose:LPS heptosyltransferase